ncbi:serine hydrolase domain-containing protein [Paenibacillus sp. LHD-38]|uniref:serine hydrolase domain-containing protein n=1 Tax=Paenibacillus sp. LHD-38 TaxID=3072143 RepID=UPI00280D070A|nr:serine hydrolase domain-containing protein [Paenibacillus sp. LHD-38]MDQ8737852.1 serine hydrolase domain-containing protein [Paenibacillus sp. LHD-38]
MYAASLMSNELLSQRLDEHCSSLAQSGYLNGCVLVALEGRILLSKGYGMANFEHDVPNTPQTKFRIGSITKQFTAMAIVIMHELKLLNVNDSVSKYIPSYPYGDKITIHHLLTHTAGIPNFTAFDDYVARMGIPSSTADTVARFSGLPLLFEPGTQFDYSNSGYVLLSYLIEQISGRSYSDYIHHALLKPLGMINSGYDDAAKILKNRAAGYEVWGGLVHAGFTDMSIPSGAGGMYSTIEDLYIWGLSLHSQRQINEQAYERMTTPFNGKYGYGLFVYEEEIHGSNRKVIGHSGGINGFISEMKHYKDEDLTFIVLSNLVTTQAGPISKQLAQIAFGDELQPRPAYIPVVLAASRQEELLGSYAVEDEPNLSLKLTLEQGKLYISQDKWFKFELCPYRVQEHKINFFLNGMEGTVAYSSSDGGGELLVQLYGGEKKAVKRFEE